MKVTIEFDDTEEREELVQAIHAGNMHSVLFEIEHNFWRKIEWYLDANSGSMSKYEIAEYIQNALSMELEEIRHLF